MYRKDNNEFPHGLFDPAWKLRLQTVADRLQGYFDHPEPKSNGKVGELKRKIVVSLDKHYIGKEMSPLDDDNELLRDDEPITTSSDLVLRSAHRNLQPLIDAGLSFRQGKRLTFEEMHKLKKNVVLHADGALTARRLTCEDYLALDNPAWLTRNKAWKNLQTFGRFPEVATASGIPLTDIDYAARWGNQCDFRCDEFDWAAILKATEDVSGIAATRNKVKAAKRKHSNRKSTRRGRQKASILLSEMQASDCFLFPTEIVTSHIEADWEDDDYGGLASADIVSPEYLPPEVEYWSPASRKKRSNTATAARMTKHRKKSTKSGVSRHAGVAEQHEEAWREPDEEAPSP